MRTYVGGLNGGHSITKLFKTLARFSHVAIPIAVITACGADRTGSAPDSRNIVIPLVGSSSGKSAPTITGTPATMVITGNTYSFRPSTFDHAGHPLKFSIQNRPPWAAFNTATGHLSGAPASSDVGEFANIVISVSDGSSSAALPAFAITAVPASTATPKGNGNFDPTFVPMPADFLYVDLNSAVNGTGSSASSPTNKLPTQISNGQQLLFNSESGVQTVPCQNDAVIANGSNMQISSYGSGRATVSGFQIFSGGWTQVGKSSVWQRSYAGGKSGAGPVVGSMIDLSSTRESPTGDVLNWQNLEEEDDKVGAFRNDPTVLTVGGYAYDWERMVMYVNVGADPNSRQLGISCVGHFINTPRSGSPSKVTVHNLRLTGFARSAVSIVGAASYWHLYNNELYANGGMYNVTAKWYSGSGIVISQNANNIEIADNRIIQTFDSPITPQHFGGSTGGHLHDLHIHDNYINEWALGAVEISDFGTHNQFSNITIEDNIAINGGRGFSRTGDTPQGFTDGIQVKGGKSGTFTTLIIRRNKINAYNSNILIGGNNFTNAVIVEGNTLSGADYGINNQRPNSATISETSNVFCGNTVQIRDTAPGSRHLHDSFSTARCPID